MKAHTASLINAIVLIAVSTIGFFMSGMASFTPFIPAVFGVLLLACYPGIKSSHKVIAHVAAALTLLVLIALTMPLQGAIGRGDGMAIARVSIMLAATAFALVMFIKSFIDARKTKAQ